MTKQQMLLKKYGDPSQPGFESNFMMLYSYPADIAKAIPSIGKSIYLHKDFKPLYETFLRLLIARNLHKQIKSNDECFNIRLIRGSAVAMSMHSWGMAVDLNTKDNPMGLTREQAVAAGHQPFTREFQQAARDCGLQPGYDFMRIDGMHFEIKKESI